ncbi:Cullin binding-domain-containing protein [Boletus reticuloceps]|uniref:Defective in cullin neddylation protein n=1 Tax=Boletus reticuloceps TaxID=495285 RepID=A0A8I2YXW9_9AGAM|nr:Cullin binding-domain-containing protein [Boletus reticuloceps]
MPPKRKRAEADSAVEGSTTRSGKKSSRTTREKNGAADVTENAGASNAAVTEPQPKKTRAKGKTNTAVTRGTKAAPRACAIDDEPLNSTTCQQQRDDELVMPKQASSTVLTRVEYTQRGAQALFKSFADDDNPDVIGPGGVEKLCTEAGIPLEGAQPLLLAWQFKAQEMAKISRSEWLQGAEALRISSLPVLAIALKELDDLVVHDKEPITVPSPVKKRGGLDSQELYNKTHYSQYAANRKAAFTELYQFCFTLAKPPHSRNLDIETATALWSVLLAPRYPIITELAEFLNENGSYKGANKDIWNMVHEFCQTIIDGELSDYEADGAWPTMLDDFAGWKKDRKAHSTDDTPR